MRAAERAHSAYGMPIEGAHGVCMYVCGWVLLKAHTARGRVVEGAHSVRGDIECAHTVCEGYWVAI